MNRGGLGSIQGYSDSGTCSAALLLSESGITACSFLVEMPDGYQHTSCLKDNEKAEKVSPSNPIHGTPSTGKLLEIFFSACRQMINAVIPQETTRW